MSRTEVVSHDHVEGFVSHLWQGKDKDSSIIRACAHTLCAVMEGGDYERGGEDIDETPGVARTTHLTSQQPESSGGGACVVPLLIGSKAKRRGRELLRYLRFPT